MKILRTPDECFDNLEDYPFEPNYIDIEHNDQTLRMHFLDENSESEEIVLLMATSEEHLRETHPRYFSLDARPDIPNEIYPIW